MTIPVDPLASSPAQRLLGALPLRIRPSMLPGVALVAILLVGLVSSLYTLAFKRGDLPAQDMSWSAAADGKTAAAVANLLQHANPAADPLVTVDRVAAYLATGDLGARVRRGAALASTSPMS